MSSKSVKEGASAPAAAAASVSAWFEGIGGDAASAVSQLASGSLDFAAGALDNSMVAAMMGRNDANGDKRIDKRARTS